MCGHLGTCIGAAGDDGGRGPDDRAADAPHRALDRKTTTNWGRER